MAGSDPPVVVDQVWKKFRGGQRQDSLRDVVPALAARMFGRRPDPQELGNRDFWALQDVSFEVQRGEALGIIGPNGAGKSTMLKVLNRILKPTRGHMIVRGQVAALIEVAAGFHQDLTGRENIFLQGAIMGMRRPEMLRKVDSIIDFAGVEAFIDTPVKRYSSGMNARLGFAIAAHLDPDVLLIDEVLAVGDMAFQEKCVARMKEFKHNGIAIIFISHNMQAVSDLCDTGVHLKSSVKTYGPIADVIGSYLRASHTAEADSKEGEVSILSVRLLGSDVDGMTRAEPGAPLRLLVEYRVNALSSDFHCGIALFRSTDGLLVYDRSFRSRELGLHLVPPGKTLLVEYDLNANLTRGQYHFDCDVNQDGSGRDLARRSHAAHLRVDELRTYAGVADLNVRATIPGRAAVVAAAERNGTDAPSGSPAPRR